MSIIITEMQIIFAFCIFDVMDERLNKLKEVLVGHGISQKDLAAQLGKNEHTISNWCVNKSQPHLKELYRIAELLKIDVCDLLVSRRTKHIE